MYSKILVAYDGSDLGKKALDFAVQMASVKESAEVVVVHVSNIPIYTYEVMGSNDLIEAINQYGQELLDEAVSNISEGMNPDRIHALLLTGRPANEILNIAKEQKANLIVMGNRGLGGLKEFFLGSVSYEVVQRSEIPVMVIK